MSGTPQREAIVASDSAIIDACAALSMTHGPAMSASGAPPPIGDRSGHHARCLRHQAMPASAGRAAPACVLC